MKTPNTHVARSARYSRKLPAFGLIGILACFGLGVSTAIASASEAWVDTTSGKLLGLPPDAAGIRAFLGIPYAQPPIGKLRFLPPRLALRSARTLQATRYGPVCAQRPENDPKSYGNLHDEDCLTLNVWTPGIAGRRPVMVWIHGGGDTQGSGRGDASAIAHTGDVVVVTVNYRLGIFGFVDVSGIGGARYKESANDGLLDQLMALQWVRRNIAAFGGDPRNVTVFGESAGGTDISALLAVRSPERYFHRAIIESGPASSTKSLAVARRFSQTMFARAGIHSKRELMRMSTAQLLSIQSAALKPLPELERDAAFQPTVDGTLIDRFPIDALRLGNARAIDLLIGSTRNELRGYLEYNPRWADVKLSQIIGLRQLPEATRRFLWAGYGRYRLPGTTNGQMTLDIAGDYIFWISGIRMAEAQVAHNKNVYMYLFTWKVADSILGSPHGTDVPFVFGDYSADLGGDRAAFETLSTHVQQYWTSFARSGAPASPGTPQWAPYGLHHRYTMVLDSDIQLVADPFPGERRLWNGLNLVRTNF